MNLATEQLTFRFGPVAAPQDVTLQLSLPTRALVLGPGGSGKTLLLKALAALATPTSGRVLWDGRDVARLTRAERRAGQARMGFVFQTDALFDSDSVLGNVRLPLVRRGVPEKEAEARAREALAEVGLSGFEAALPETLSGGMRKRVGIARAIAARPEVLLVDEPLAGLDPGTGGRVVELLRRLSEGHTLVVASPEPIPGLEAQLELTLPRPTREP